MLVTDGGRVVAQLGPPRSGRSSALEDPLLAEAIREGWLTPPALSTDGPPPRKPVMRFNELMRDVARDREDR